uniref:Uncharacterized protein n=1 Tax=Arundo donax TaxID=35708 RepID=A0A0A9DM36_ARUDO
MHSCWAVCNYLQYLNKHAFSPQENKNVFNHLCYCRMLMELLALLILAISISFSGRGHFTAQHCIRR